LVTGRHRGLHDFIGLLCLFCIVLGAVPSSLSAQTAATPGPSAGLYRELRDSGLDLKKVYRVRDATFDREDLHFALNDGWLIVGEQVAGHVTAAFFVGDGEVLLIPPDLRERASVALFLNAAVLEEKFTSAYFRFFDDHFLDDLDPALRKGENPEIGDKANVAAKELAKSDALRLLISYLNAPANGAQAQRFLHARLVGTTHSTFDVFYDEAAPEQIGVGQVGYTPRGAAFYNVWTSFASRSHRNEELSPNAGLTLMPKSFRIKVTVHPPESLDGEADLELETLQPNTRAVLFELSRALKVSSVTSDGHPLEFLQNEAVEGSRISREGNDYVAVILPHAPAVGARVKLQFTYSGSVLADAGNGLLYVGSRGNWYPNLGLNMAMFDLEFRYPPEWTLVATGQRVSQESVEGERVSHWRSERPIPVAGFNLGHYEESDIAAGRVKVESFAAAGVERSFPSATQTVVEPIIGPERNDRQRAVRVPLPPPKPAGEIAASEAAATIDYLSPRIGPFPFGSLLLTQMPGDLSQGWPGLVFLSSYVFVPQQERGPAANSDFDRVLFDRLMVPHETAHQWWGDSVYWTTYRDKWISEALANYSAMLTFEEDYPKEFKTVLEYYRTRLEEKGADGRPNREAGPVTLGHRLNSSAFPQGWDLVAYGRGTWLMHMLREFLCDGERKNGAASDDLFYSVLKRLQHDYAGKQMSTADMQRAFERALPKSLYYEGKPKLDWFFDGWVNGTAMPRYSLTNVRLERRSGGLRATGKIMQKDAPEELITAVPIYAELAKGDLRFLTRVFADGAETPISLNVPPGTKKLVVDPYSTILTAP
jgi:peptidase M1-like protein